MIDKLFNKLSYNSASKVTVAVLKKELTNVFYVF